MTSWASQYQMLMNLRWLELEYTNYYVRCRGKGKGGSKFVSLEARQSNKEKGHKCKGSTSKSMDDEAGDKEHLAVESVVQDEKSHDKI